MAEKFKILIEHELTASKPLDQFHPVYEWLAKEKNAHAFLRNHISSGPNRPDNSRLLLHFIEKIVDVLLVEFAPADLEPLQLRQQYTDDISLGLTSSEYLPTCNSLLRMPIPAEWETWNEEKETWCRATFLVIRDNRNGDELNRADLLAAASAVGNLAALRHYTSDLDDLGTKGGIFHTAFDAAITTNKISSLELLLKKLEEQYPPELLASPCFPYEYHWQVSAFAELKCSYSKAVKQRKSQIAKLIIYFLIKYDHAACDSMKDAMGHLLQTAMSAGCIDTTEYILSTFPNFKTYYGFKYDLGCAYMHACMYGDTQFIEHCHKMKPSLFPRSRFRFDCDQGKKCAELQCPLSVAAQYARVDVVKLLLRSGADLREPNHLLRKIIEGIGDGDWGIQPIFYGPRFEVTKFLLDNGVSVPWDTVYLVSLSAFLIGLMNTAHPQIVDGYITLVLLLVTVKGRFGATLVKKSLPTQLVDVCVVEVLKQIVDAKRYMQHGGKDYLKLAEEAYDWLSQPF